MKIIYNKKYIGIVILGALYGLIGLIEILFIFPSSGYLMLGVSRFILGVLVLIFGLYLSRKSESEVVIDERVTNIRNKAGFYAFLSIVPIIMFFILFDVLLFAGIINIGSFMSIFIFRESNLIIPLILRYVFISFICVNIFVGLMIYYRKKGD